MTVALVCRLGDWLAGAGVIIHWYQPSEGFHEVVDPRSIIESTKRAALTSIHSAGDQTAE